MPPLPRQRPAQFPEHGPAGSPLAVTSTFDSSGVTRWAYRVLGPLPAVEDGLYLIRHLTAGLVPVPTLGKQFVVGGLGVTDVRDYSQVHGLFIESLCCGGTTYPPAMSKAGVLCDGILGSRRAIRKQFAHASCKARHVHSVEFGAPLDLALTTARAHFTIG